MSTAPDPRTYTPSHLAEKILRDRSRLEGERRRVTVLFVDAVGSTPITEKIDEEEAYSLMQRFVSQMMESVHRYEGTVTQFRGDGIMALFGAPIAHEDSARRAVSGALDMRDSLQRLAEQVERETGLEYRFRIGLNTGPVVVGNIGEDLTMQYTAIGDTVNLGARMEQAAEPGTIFMTENTCRLVEDWCECEPGQVIEVKGKTEPVTVYKAIKEKGARTRLEIAAERGLTPYVGRLQELMILQGFYGQVSNGRGHVVFISGEAGIGKSRLLLEFRHSLGDEVKWIEGHCISYGRNMPYLPIIDVLKRSFAVEESDDEAAITSRVDAQTGQWDEASRTTVPYLKFLLNVDPGDLAVATMDPRERRAGIFDALRALIVQESRDRPVVVVVEDLHWIDEKSDEALAALIDVVDRIPVLLLLTYRPGYVHSLGDRTFFSRVALGPLPSEDSEQVATSVCAASSLPGEIRDLILSKAEGNPFFIEEVTKSLIEFQVLGRRDGDLVLLRPVEEVRIPDDIQDVILARIDRLESDAKQAIQLASVIGREFTVRLLERISGVESKLDEVLRGLKTLELIYEKTFFPELAYMFKHALTHDVAYSTLLKERRKALHLIVARAIEELYAERLAEYHETLAHHYYEAQEWAKALEYLLLAGTKATAALSPKDAIVFAGRALEVAEKLGAEGLAGSAMAFQLRGMSRLGTGDLPGALSDIDSMTAASGRLADRHGEGMGHVLLGFIQLLAHNFDACEEDWRSAYQIGGEGFDDVRLGGALGLFLVSAVTGQHEKVPPLFEESKNLAPRVEDPFTSALWTGFGAIILHWRGEFEEAIEHLERNFTAVEMVGDVTLAIGALWTEALSLGGRGSYEAALDALNEGLRRAERSGEVFYQARILNTVGWIYIEIQDFQTAMDWNQRSWDLAELIEAPDPEIQCNARLNLADCLVTFGRLDEAEEHDRAVEKIYRNPAPPEIFMLWRYSQHLLHSYGELCLMRGEHDRALAYAEECLEMATKSESKKNVVKSRRLKGEVSLAQGRIDEADTEITAALALARDLRNPTQIWKTLEALGRLRREQGRDEEAREAFAKAIAVIEDVAAGLKPERRDALLASKAVARLKGA